MGLFPGLGEKCGAEGAFGVVETYPCVWNDSTSLKVNNPLSCSTEDSLASVPPASASHDCDGFTLQEEGTATCAKSYEAKSSATTLDHSDMPLRRPHQYRYGFAVHQLRHDDLVAVLTVP